MTYEVALGIELQDVGRRQAALTRRGVSGSADLGTLVEGRLPVDDEDVVA